MSLAMLTCQPWALRGAKSPAGTGEWHRGLHCPTSGGGDGEETETGVSAEPIPLAKSSSLYEKAKKKGSSCHNREQARTGR
jgi:hypothetical protein